MLFGKTKKEDETAAPGIMPNGLADVVFDAGDADFEQNVLLASMERPVIVDFWATWCGPCKQLTPVLEKIVRAAGGAVLLAKVDVDKNQGVAAALQVQSIPTVYAFFQGRPVDGFQGALPEAQIKAFVDKLVKIGKQAAPDAIDIPETLKGAAAALAAGNATDAQALYGQILLQDKSNAHAYAGIVRAVIAMGETAQARELVSNAPPEISNSSVFAEARTALELAENAPSVGALNELTAKAAANPADHQARYDLALAQFSSGKKEEAIDNLLEIIRKNRAWNEDAARAQLLKFFEALGPADPLTLQGRRKLSSILFS